MENLCLLIWALFTQQAQKKKNRFCIEQYSVFVLCHSSNQQCVFVCFSTSDGLESFSQFLRTEFSEENIEFWLACEEYKTIDSETKLLSKAKYIYAVYIESEAPKEVWCGMFIYH